MLNIIVTYTLITPSTGEAFVKELEESGAAAAVRAEDGCHQYEYFYPAGDKGRVVLLEQWDSREKQAVHMTQPHMAVIKRIKDKYCSDTQVKFLSE